MNIIYGKFSKYYYYLKRTKRRILLVAKKRLHSRYPYSLKARVNQRYFRVAFRGAYRRPPIFNLRKFWRLRRYPSAYHKFGSFINLYSPSTRLAGWAYNDQTSLNILFSGLHQQLTAKNPLLKTDIRIPFTTFNFQFSTSLNPKEGYFSQLRKSLVFNLSRSLLKTVCKRGFGWFQRFETMRELHFYFTRFVPNLPSIFNQYKININDFNYYFLDYNTDLNVQLARTLRGAARPKAAARCFLRFEKVFRLRLERIRTAFFRFFIIRFQRFLINSDRLNFYKDYKPYNSTFCVLGDIYKKTILQRK